ncbi:MAG: hypothetical protein M1834_009048 [Cirrosporium novae-zelandiae]|nr:MAG: hypothetical protein M1834_009048 [Cirrosporium novae-zelandiae]
MKIITKEEEEQHYSETLKGGLIGGVGGVALGALGVIGASRRYHAFRSLTIPLRAFFVTSAGTFGAIIEADRYSRSFEAAQHGTYEGNSTSDLQRQIDAAKTPGQRTFDWFRDHRYPIVGVSWVASMGLSLWLVGRNPYLTTSQKLVQARVYAQGLTVAVLMATAAFEIGDRNKGQGRWETVKILDPDDPEHKHLIEKRIHHERYAGEDLWKDMVEAEERRIKAREEAVNAEKEQANKTKTS